MPNIDKENLSAAINARRSQVFWGLWDELETDQKVQVVTMIRGLTPYMFRAPGDDGHELIRDALVCLSRMLDPE